MQRFSFRRKRSHKKDREENSHNEEQQENDISKMKYIRYELLSVMTLTHLCNNLPFWCCKMTIFRYKIRYFLLIARNIDLGYSLELP